MSRHPDFVPQGVIPAALLPFHEDLSIDEASFRSHLRDVGAVHGLSAVTINAHSTEVASCTADEQRRVMEITGEEVGDTMPIVHGVWADGSLEAARIARRDEAGGATALLVFPPAPFTLGQSAEMVLAHFKTIGDATDLPLIVFQYPLATGQGYPARHGIQVNGHWSCRISSRNCGFQLALLRRVLTLPLRLLARTRPRAKRRTAAMFFAPWPVR